MAQQSDAPALSVVVVSFNRTLHLLEQCLQALASQHIADGVEIIVVRNRKRCDDDRTDGLSREFSCVTWLEATDGTIPHMRRLGIANSHGRLVALIEDDCVVDHSWAGAVLRAHAGPHVAVGGAVEPGDFRTALDWAAYFCDYATFMLPFRRENTWVLAGNNVSYKRDVVPELLALTVHDGLQEAFLHRAWHEGGKPMQADPTIIVRNQHRWTLADVLAVPFFHGRAFGGRRAREWPVEQRALFALGAAVLPLMHLVRISRRVLGRGRFAGPLVRALPWIGLFGASWAAGECVGYAAGPGDSLRHWR